MNYDVPKVPLKPQYSVERSFIAAANDDVANNDYVNPTLPQAENLGGHFLFTSNMTVSGTSLSNSANFEQVTYVPESGPLPQVEIELHHLARNMELAAEIRFKKDKKV